MLIPPRSMLYFLYITNGFLFENLLYLILLNTNNKEVLYLESLSDLLLPLETRNTNLFSETL